MVYALVNGIVESYLTMILIVKYLINIVHFRSDVSDLDLNLTIHNEFSYNNTNDPLITNINCMNIFLQASIYMLIIHHLIRVI